MTDTSLSSAPAEPGSGYAPIEATSAPPFGRYERMLAGRYMRAKRAHGGVALISLIAFVGIMLAVGVLIVVMSVMNGFRDTLLSKILGVEAHAYVYTLDLPPADVDELAARLTTLKGITHAAPVLRGQGLAASTGVAGGGVVVTGIRPEDLANVEIVVESVQSGRGGAGGDLSLFGEGFKSGDYVVVGRGVADQLGLTVGDEITIVTVANTYTVTGSTPRRKAYEIAATFSVGSSNYDGVLAYMPLEQARIFFQRREATDYIEVRVEDPDKIDSYLPALRAAVEPDGFVRDWRDQNQAFFTALKVERNVMRIILMLVVAIAAMNIISGLVMLAKNKGRDIAILRTMGATRGGIVRVFFLTGATIGVLGTLAGLVVGVLFCLYIEPIQGFVEAVTGTRVFDPSIYMLSRLPAKLEWSEVFLVASWGLVMACAATLPPAWNAARQDPVEALRNE